ncbi:hypothetical protein GCM10022223_68630 [Kineosporia mesophila]|uniref:FlgD/Vpr Ig-like domain-containing protein n=1 Tax=Kineosporia mesophila TaxID=566012 RepID=A0ABP7ATX9_9ACTN|nr:FlgD immunoglobulin-like domain containing protein [Kineosporia mesophila]MCD5353153.1 hypothetical protein [Kineosporia mesophila]
MSRATPVAPSLVVRPRSAPDLEVRISPDDDLSVSRTVPPTPPPAGVHPSENPPDNAIRYARLAPGVLALSLVLTGAVDAPDSTGEPVRTRAQALAARTVAPAATLRIAGHPASTAVRLIGASEDGIAIWQGAPQGVGSDGTPAPATVYTGALTSRDGTMRLAARPGAGAPTRAGSLLRLSVTGPTLAWYELGGGDGGSSAYPQEHRLDLAGGRDLTDDRAGSLAVRQKLQGGDATAPYAQIDPDGLLATQKPGRWLEFGGMQARIVAREGRWVLESRRANRKKVTRALLPHGINVNSGLDAVGDRFYTASSGLDPAVYVVQGRSVTQVAKIPAARYPITSWALSAGTLHFTDQSAGKKTTNVFSTTLTSTADTVTRSPSARLPQTTGPVPLAFSAGRGALAAPGAPGEWQLLDQGATTARVAQRLITRKGVQQRIDDDSPAVSGPYALVAGQVFRPDGELVWREPAAAALAGQDDLYGADVVYSVPEGGKDTKGHDLAGVWSVGVERPLPVRLDTTRCAQAPPVAIWAGSAAWANCDGSHITVQDLRTGGIRDVDTGLGLIIGSGPAPITGLSLREGVLAWIDGDALSLLDLADPHSSPLVLPGSTARFMLDGNLVARQTGQGLVVDRLPFPVNSRPRLIAAAAPLGFTPDGDGKFDRWQPQFDVTRPVRNARLRIVAPSGRVVRTFRIPGGADGSLRGITWDGRSDAGRPLAEGPYTWELTARAVDGGGTLTSAASLARARGSIEISSTGPSRPKAR